METGLELGKGGGGSKLLFLYFLYFVEYFYIYFTHFYIFYIFLHFSNGVSMMSCKMYGFPKENQCVIPIPIELLKEINVFASVG